MGTVKIIAFLGKLLGSLKAIEEGGKYLNTIKNRKVPENTHNDNWSWE